MTDQKYLEKRAIEYADKNCDQTIDPLMHSMLKAAVSFGWSLHYDYCYKTHFNPKQDLESYVGGNYPDDIL